METKLTGSYSYSACVRKTYAAVAILILSNRVVALTESGAQYDQPKVVSDAESRQPFRCYHCSSPESVIRDIKIKDTLQLIKTQFVKITPDWIDPECARPKNVSLLAQHTCSKHNLCLKWFIHDGTNPPFVIRGCVDKVLTSDVTGREDEAFQNTKDKNKCEKTKTEWHLEYCVCDQSTCNLSNSLKLPSWLCVLLLVCMYLVFYDA